MRLTRRHRAALSALTIPALITLAGCSSDETDKSDEKKSEENATSSSAGVDPDKVSPTDLATPPAIENAAGARQDAEIGDCATEAGEQQVTGKVTNSGAEPTDYVVVVNWINDTSDVMGRGVAVLQDVPAGESVDWSVTAAVADGAAGCTLNVQKGTVAE